MKANIIDKKDSSVYTKYIRKELSNMTSKIQKWGNSHGIRIPKAILETVKWKEDECVEIFIENNKIVIEKLEDKNRKNIKQLFENYKGEYEPIDIDWGKTEGNEIW